MPTNKLRHQAHRFLQLALKAQDKGRLASAHTLTLKAAKYLEDAVAVEELRQRTSLSQTKKSAKKNSRI
jgi:hypothetical protein